MKKEKVGYAILILSIIIAIVGIFAFVEPIAQNEEYHNFIDSTKIFGVPNFLNVISNLPFLIVGLIALIHLKAMKGVSVSGMTDCEWTIVLCRRVLRKR